MEPNHIYQFSLLNALMSGISEHGITASKLATKGNQGLGTFAMMDGELLFLDGTIYQLQSHGRVREASPSDQIPFAVSTNFVAQKTVQETLAQKDDLDRVLEAWKPHAKNLFITYRVTGTFAHLKCRTVQGQSYPGEPLSDLGKKQSVEEYEAVRGTIIGVRTPANWQGFGVAGEHMHFLREDKKAGGHVLELKTDGQVEVQMAVASNVHIELPTGEDFNDAELVTDDAGVKEVEG